MDDNRPEASAASGVVSEPKNWLPVCFALLNLVPHGLATLFYALEMELNSPGPALGTGIISFFVLLDTALLAALFCALLWSIWRGWRVALCPLVLALLALMEFLFWVNARLVLPYARTLGEWLWLMTPGQGWEEVGAAGWAERAFFWLSRLLALGSTIVGAALLEMSVRVQWETSGREKAALLMKWAVAAALIGAVFVTTGNGEKKEGWDARNYISEQLEMDCRNAELLEAYNSHGGFHGDGESFYVLKFDDDSLLKMIENSRRWKPLPLTDALVILAYGTHTENTVSGPFFEQIIPHVENGWYWFLDRQATGEARYGDAEVMCRFSYNIALALYDEDKRTLYYAELDT